MSAHVGFRPDVQGLRALAVVAVVAYHAGVLPGGFAGVDVFFVISGFVIGRLLLAELNDTGRIDLRRFYSRRARRLLPALAVMLTAVVAGTPVLVGFTSWGQTLNTARAAALFHANLHLAGLPGAGYFDPAAERNPLLHTWSLSIEEQFYFVLPVMMLTAWSLGRRCWSGPEGSSSGGGRRGVIGILAAVLGVSLLLSWLWTYQPSEVASVGGSPAFFSPAARAWEFLVGVMVAAYEPRLRRLRRAAATLLSTLGWAGVISSFLVLDASWPFPGLLALWPVIATAALVAAGAPDSPGPRFAFDRLLTVRPAVRLGDWSYSWYLWHWPLIVFAENLFPLHPEAVPAAAIVSLVPAWLSFRLVEQPLRGHVRRVKRAAQRPEARPALTTTLIVTLSLAGPVTIVSLAQTATPAWTAEVSPLLDPFEFHEDYLRGCDETRYGQLPLEECTWLFAGTAVGVAMLIGDSHAGHLTEAFVVAAHKNKLDAVVRTRSSCAMVEAQQQIDRRTSLECDTFYRRMRQEAADMNAAVVVVAVSHALYLSERATFFENGRRVENYQEKLAWWSGALASTAEDLQSTGAQTILVLPTPRFEGADVLRADGEGVWSAAWLAPWRLSRAPETFALSISRQQALEATHDARQAVQDAADASGASTLDLWDTVCPGDRCVAYADGRWLYRDMHHLSVGAAELLADPLHMVVDQALRPLP